MADLITSLCELLKADAQVLALAGTRVFGGELPEDETSEMPRRTILLQRSGGPSLTGSSNVEHDTQRIDLRAYGPTPFEASELARVVWRVFRRTNRIVVADLLIHWITTAGGASDGREAGTLWPVSFRSFQVFHALEAI